MPAEPSNPANPSSNPSIDDAVNPSAADRVLADALSRTQEELFNERRMIEEQRTNIASLTEQVNLLMSRLNAQVKPSFSSSDIAKPAKPSVFDGRNVNVARTWLAEVEQYYRAVKMTDEILKVEFAAAQLRGEAADWWSLNKPTEDDMRAASLLPDQFPHVIYNWERFKSRFLSIYNPRPAKDTARAALDNLRQDGPLQQYVNEFTKHIILLSDEMSNDAQIYQFRRGLKPYLREKLQFIRPKDLQEAMSETLRLEQESKQYYRPKFNSSNNSSKPWNKNYQSNYTPVSSRNTTTNNNNTVSRDSNGPAPMELGNVEDHPVESDVSQLNMIAKLSPEERKHCYEKGLCFRCRLPGHLKINCPKNTEQNNNKS